MASIAIAPATGVVTLTPRWGIGGSLAGFHLMSQNTGFSVGANDFYSIKSTTIPAGGDVAAFTYYIAASGAATNHADVGSKLTPDSYSALSSADPDVGFGAVNFYLIHHKGTTDYFTTIVPGSGTSSAVTDLKPMSGPGGPATVTGVNGYFGLTFAGANLGYGLNLFYYLRTDPVTSVTKFGTLAPALLGLSADQFDLGTGGHKALTFTGTDVGYGVNKMYYLRLDPVTGFTILGMLDPALAGVRHTSDIANLGSVFSTLDFVPGDVGYGAGRFYTTGSVNPTWQSVSFAAIPDIAINAGPSGQFTVTPSASSGGAIALTVVAGSVGAASISAPVAGVFTVRPTSPGLITLQATQAGVPGTFEFNMLRQSFTATGVGAPVITSGTTAAGVIGTTFAYSIVASGTPTSYGATGLPPGLTLTANAIGGTPTTAGTYPAIITATNASGTDTTTLTITVTATALAPVITSPLTAPGTVGAPFFTYFIVASGGPTSFTSSGLPAGLVFNATTGSITGTPTTAGISIVTLGATNTTGTGKATLTITVAAAAVAPIITSAITAPGSVGTTFVTYNIIATGLPTSYGATGLPAGLTVNSLTGRINGTPTTAGIFVATLNATNSTGTGTATLTITVAAAGVAPIVTNGPLTAAATIGTPFTFTIAATGTPTSYAASPLPAGLSIVAGTGVITGTPTAGGTTAVLLGATNATGTGTATLTITVGSASGTPIITSPTSVVGTVGTTFVTYPIVATGLPTSYSATGLPAGLSINAISGAINGTPTTAGTSSVTLQATNAIGTGTTILTITVAPIASSRIVAFSARALSGPGDQTLIVGFVVSGDNKNLLVRGVGPGLAAYGIVNFLADPMLTLYGNNNAVIATNDNWQTDSSGLDQTALIAATAARVGAFALQNASKDSALLYTLNNGAHTTSLLRPNSTTGVALTEIYDIDTVLSARLIAVSARMNVTLGEGTLIAGISIAGNAPKTLLIRGIGPGLTAFGVSGVLADPQIAIFSGSTQIASNDNWETGTSTAAQISAATAQVGEFPLSPGSKDAALLITLQPGLYTVVVTGVGNTTGVALVEIYDTQ
jgi:PKD repeat protein